MLATEARAQEHTLPPIVVEGETIDGELVKCFSSICQGIMQISRVINMDGMDAEIGQEGDVDGEKFCRLLNSARPSGCSLVSPPQTPGNDPYWTAGTCDAGALLPIFDGIRDDLPDEGNFELGHPDYDIWFYSACMSLDRCYAEGQYSRSVCDLEFSTNLDVACGTSPNPQCPSYQDLYEDALRNNGEAAYDQWSSDRQCAVWHQEMEVNNCDKH